MTMVVASHKPVGETLMRAIDKVMRLEVNLLQLNY